MKATWIERRGHDRAAVFLNGWGMDASVFRLTPPPEGHDLLMLNDYRDLEVPGDALAAANGYTTTVVVGWSMGVWAAGAIEPHLQNVAGSLAINGTGRPVDGEYGIPPKPYRLTMRRFDERGRGLFYERICGTPDRTATFLDEPPLRPLAEQCEELAAIPRQQEAGLPKQCFPFANAVIGGEDVIFPPDNQARYWQDRAKVIRVPMPHLPFLDITWLEMIRYACGD